MNSQGIMIFINNSDKYACIPTSSNNITMSHWLLNMNSDDEKHSYVVS